MRCRGGTPTAVWIKPPISVMGLSLYKSHAAIVMDCGKPFVLLTSYRVLQSCSDYLRRLVPRFAEMETSDMLLRKLRGEGLDSKSDWTFVVRCGQNFKNSGIMGAVSPASLRSDLRGSWLLKTFVVKGLIFEVAAASQSISKAARLSSASDSSCAA